MPYYHSSKVEHPNGRVLTGPATRGVVSQWCGKEPTFDGYRVYLWVGDGDPRTLSTISISQEPLIVYEVEPQDEPLLDCKLGPWDSVSCESALVVACVYRPAQEPDQKA